MGIQFSTDVNNGRLDAIETIIGTAPTLEIRSGAPPANAAASDAGTLLASITLPSDWMAAASSGSKSKSGTWTDSSADASGKPSHFRIKASGVCKMQGLACGPWAPSTAYSVGDHVINDSGKIYRVTGAGTSASSGGPTGTGGSIVDSGVTWAYVQAGADMALDAGSLMAGQTFTVSTFTLTSGNA